jgi:hypothetical protein
MPAIVLRTASSRNFDVTPPSPGGCPAGVPAPRAEGEDALGTAGKMPALQVQLRTVMITMLAGKTLPAPLSLRPLRQFSVISAV